MKLDVLKPEQIQELLNVIDTQNMLFVAQHVGWDVLLPADREKLTQLGFTKEKLGELSYAELAFQFGMLSNAAKANVDKIKYKDFKKFIASGKFIPLNEVERSTLENLQTHLYSDIRGLGNRMEKDFTNILIEADKNQRAQYEKIIRNELTQTVANRETMKDTVSRLGHATGDWSRDFGRIADYVLHDSFDRGRVAAIKKYSSSKDPLIYKDVYAGACKYCKALYLKKGGQPKVFKLSTLEANGSNIGRKSADLQPVLGPTHPFCRCTSNEVPANSKWNEETNSFELQARKRKVPRKSKITVTVGDKTMKI